MAKTTNKAGGDRRLTLLFIACGALLLALICVSAFAYQWHGENKELKRSNTTLRALTEQSTLDSLTTELGAIRQELLTSQSQNAEYARKIKLYEDILTENNLMPAAD